MNAPGTPGQVNPDDFDPVKVREALEGLEIYPADNWQEQGYTSPAAEVADMANVGRALIERIGTETKSGPLEGWMPADCPTEIVTDLLNRLEDATPTPVVPEGLRELSEAATPTLASGNVSVKAVADLLAGGAAQLNLTRMLSPKQAEADARFIVGCVNFVRTLLAPSMKEMDQGSAPR
jgi:hypothetical protein